MTSELTSELTGEPPQARPPRSPGLTFGLALLAYLAFNLLLPWVPLPAHRPPQAVVLSIVVVSTAAFMLLQCWLALATVQLRPRSVVAALLTVLFVLGLGITFAFIRPHRDWPLAVNIPLVVLQKLMMGVCITLGCAFFGILLSRIIREPNVLLPVALVAMPIDYLGAMTPIGFTQNAVAQNPKLVQALSVPVPAVGGGAAHAGVLQPIAFIGPGDALFMAFFFAVALRLSLNVRGTFWWTYGLLTATMLIVLLTDVNVAALIPMGLAVVIANFRFFKLKRDEVFATLYAAGFILILVTGFYYYSHSHFYRSTLPKEDPNAARSAPNSAVSTPAPPRRPAGN